MWYCNSTCGIDQDRAGRKWKYARVAACAKMPDGTDATLCCTVVPLCPDCVKLDKQAQAPGSNLKLRETGDERRATRSRQVLTYVWAAWLCAWNVESKRRNVDKIGELG